MLFLFTPYSYFFFFFYLFFLLVSFSFRDFFFIWLFIELRMFLFISLCYRFFFNSYSPLILFYVVQTVASLSLLFTYFIQNTPIFIIMLTMKLGLFPFILIYFTIIISIPNIILFIVSTFHKILPLVLTSLILNFNNLYFLIVVLILNTVIFGLMMLSFSDLRSFIIISSLFNNVNFVFALLTFDYFFLFSFIFLYSVLFYHIIFNFSAFTHLRLNIWFSMQLVVLMFILSGFPPSPLFFVKLFLFLQILQTTSDSAYLLILFFLLNVLVSCRYVKVLIYNTICVFASFCVPFV